MSTQCVVARLIRIWSKVMSFGVSIGYTRTCRCQLDVLHTDLELQESYVEGRVGVCLIGLLNRHSRDRFPARSPQGSRSYKGCVWRYVRTFPLILKLCLLKVLLLCLNCHLIARHALHENLVQLKATLWQLSLRVTPRMKSRGYLGPWPNLSTN